MNKDINNLTYTPETRGPVRYLPVELRGRVIGFLYASVYENAASYIRRLEEQDTDSGFNGAVVWAERLEEAYADSLSAEDALRRWIGAPEHPTAGGIRSNAEFENADSYEQLDEYANGSHPPDSSEWSSTMDVGVLADGTPIDRSMGWGPLAPFQSEGSGYDVGTDSPVRYLPAYRDEDLLGYLWAADTDDAAGFIPRLSAGADGNHAQGQWIALLERCKSAGLRPLEAFRSFIGGEQDPVAGRIPTDAQEQSAANLDRLKTHARE